MEVVQNTTTGTMAAIAARRGYFPAVSWGGIVAGIIVGLAIQLVLTLLGIAAGLTAFGLGTTPPAGEVPAWVGAWQSVTVLIAAFVGGYVAARMSGLQRKGDGMLHGLVAWGATTLIVAILTTSAIGALFGRTGPGVALSSLGGNGTAQVQPGGQNPELSARLDELVRNATAQSTLDAQTTSQTMQQLQAYILAGERTPAIDLLMRTTGMPPDQATAIVDDALAFVASPLSAPTQETTEAAGVMSWWMFGAAILSMLLGVVGGLAGAAGTRRMRSADDRLNRMASA